MRYATYQIKGHADLNFYNEKIANAAEETLADKLYDLLDKASYACDITGRSKPKKGKRVLDFYYILCHEEGMEDEVEHKLDAYLSDIEEYIGKKFDDDVSVSYSLTDAEDISADLVS